MDKDFYVIFSTDDEQKIMFIEKHDKDDTILKVGTYSEMEQFAQSRGYGVVDISSWEYESYEDKCLQVRNYQKPGKVR